MASWGQAGFTNRAVVGIASAASVAAATVGAWWVLREPPLPDATVQVAAAVAPEAVPAPVAALAPAVVSDPVVAGPVAPSFDLVRIEADGAAQVAGRGEPGARVVLQVDGVRVSEALVARDGAFAALFTLAPNPKPSLLSLVMLLPDGTTVAGRETVALAAIGGPQVVADAVPPPDPAQAVVNAAAPEPTVTPAAPPAALLIAEDGVQVLQAPGAATVAVSDISIDTISYAPEGSVQFGGRGAPLQTVRLYLDNAALVDAVIAEGGAWSVTKADIAPGFYLLRADQIDQDGVVTSRFETPFKREDAIALSVAAENAAPVPEPTVAAPIPNAAPDSKVAKLVTPEPAIPEPVAPVPEASEPIASDPTKPDPSTVAVASVETVAPQVAAPDGGEPLQVPVTPAPALQTLGDASVSQSPTAPAPVATVADTAAVPAPNAPQADPVPSPAKSPVTITVQPGLTLWAIAESEFGNGVRYVQVFEANKDKIRDPDLIYPGQVFTVPAEP